MPKKEPDAKKISIQTPALKDGPSIKIKLTFTIWLFSIAKKAPIITTLIINKNCKNSRIPRKIFSQLDLQESIITFANLVDKNSTIFFK